MIWSRCYWWRRCSGHLSHCLEHTTAFNCVNMAPGSTEAVFSSRAPQSCRKTSNPAGRHRPIHKLSRCITRAGKDIVVLFFQAPVIHHGHEEKKQTMWLLLSNTSTPSRLSAAFLYRFLFDLMMPQYDLLNVAVVKSCIQLAVKAVTVV